MAEKKPLKLKKESSELLKRPFSETKSTPPDRKEYGNSFSKGKEALTPGSSSKDPVRSSSFGKNLVKVGKEFARSNEGKGGSREGKVIVGKEREPKTSELKSPIKVLGKSATKTGPSTKDEYKSPVKKVLVREEGKSPVKKDGRVLVKDELSSPIKVPSKVPSKEGKVVTKEKGNANGKDQGKSVNGKERGISVGNEGGKTNGKSSKVKDEDRDVHREKEKGKSSAGKSTLAKTPVKPASSSKLTTKTVASPTVGQSVKKQTMKTTTTTVTASKTVAEQKKEKKVFELPGQKHDPPEERDALRIFYTTLRDQIPESDMAEVWLMEYGLLPADEAKVAFERKQKRTQSGKQAGPPIKTFTPARLSNGSAGVKKSTTVSNGKGSKVVVSATPKAKKKRAAETESDDDFLGNITAKKKKKKGTS